VPRFVLQLVMCSERQSLNIAMIQFCVEGTARGRGSGADIEGSGVQGAAKWADRRIF
jgi:hypothetical protein